jgi:hypothetical protein
MYRLGLNTGFAVNRFAEPKEWTKVFKVLDVKQKSPKIPFNGIKIRGKKL